MLMNAKPKSISNVQEDAEVLIEVLLYIDPRAGRGKSPAYRKLRTTLLEIGWESIRFDRAIKHLHTEGRLFLSLSKKTISLQPVGNLKGQSTCCAYCGKTSKFLTRDHVIPKSRGGAKEASNIVLACRECNQVKADRTPAEWALDILNYDKRA